MKQNIAFVLAILPLLSTVSCWLLPMLFCSTSEAQIAEFVSSVLSID